MTGIQGCFVLFFSTFLYDNFFFFSNNKKKVLQSCIQDPEVRRKWSCDLSPASWGRILLFLWLNGVICLTCLESPNPQIHIRNVWVMKNSKTPANTVPGPALASLFTSPGHSSFCIVSSRCPLPCLIIWILCHRRRSKPVPSSLSTQRPNSLIGNCCFSSPWDGKNHFPFLQAVESHCPPGNEERFPGLYFSTCYKINYSFVSFQGWGRVNRGEMH